MKILELRFKNLNSLYGEWTIDFTSPDYVADKIFAITGPTGAGKSTILDAICLALYGRTPRLKSITKTTNEIMSRQTGECFAEVAFETQAGQFRCHWSQRRAYQKSDGNLLDSKHEISDAATHKVLESKKREVALRVEQTTGMDFDRFTRSMLLAQGGFAAFLSAAPDQRAPILEQITGTAVYSDISIQVHDRRGKEQKKLDLLLAETAGITLLNDEEEACVNLDLAAKKETEKSLGQKDETLGRWILWLLGMETLKAELLAIEEETQDLALRLAAFEPDRKRLARAQVAAELDSAYATLVSKRDQQQAELKTLAKARPRLPDLEKALALEETGLKQAEAAVVRVRTEQKAQLALIKQVRALDLHVTEKQSAVKKAAEDCRRSAAQILEKKETGKKAVLDQAAAAKTLSRVEDYLVDHARDAELITQFTGITEQIKHLQAAVAKSRVVQAQAADLKKRMEEETGRHKAQSDACTALKETHDAALKQVTETQKTLAVLLKDRLLREYRTEHETLLREMAYLGTIKSLEQERARLEDGKSCPLCGATDHPFARGNVPGMDETEKKIQTLANLIQKADQLEKTLKAAENREKTAGLKLAEAEKLLVSARHRQEDSQTQLLRTENELQAAWDKNAEFNRNLLQTLAPFGIDHIPDTGPDTLVAELKTRQKNWQKALDRKMEIEKELSRLAATLKGLDAQITTLEEAAGEKQETLESLREALEILKKDRHDRYGQKNPDTEEARLEAELAEVEDKAKAARQTRDEVKHRLNELTTRIKALEESTALRRPELAGLEAGFVLQCSKRDFPDETAFLACCLSFDDRTRLTHAAGLLDREKAGIATRKKDRETRLAREIEKKMTDLPLEDLKQDQAATREALKTLGEDIGAIKQKLSDNAAARAKLREKKEWIDAQRNECERWEALHALIGSADGKKYRNFAQGLTFEVMVSHANRQLEKMTDRYLLVRDEKQPLELNIMDNYQAGEIRSTKNLSGGESFIVSLSLALGLSNMASRNVRVDSLFLDEGFGTLDEEALETSLEALSGLQQEDKLIGIISHVSALKERISTRISIQPVSGGKSVITGPGCRSMD